VPLDIKSMLIFDQSKALAYLINKCIVDPVNKCIINLATAAHHCNEVFIDTSRKYTSAAQVLTVEREPSVKTKPADTDPQLLLLAIMVASTARIEYPIAHAIIFDKNVPKGSQRRPRQSDSAT
jgi:hypothetical protein